MTTDEVNKLLDLVEQGGLAAAIEVFRGTHHRTTISRYFNVANQFKLLGLQTLPPVEIREQIILDAGYSPTDKFVTDLFSDFQRWRDNQQPPGKVVVNDPLYIQQRKLHMELVAQTARQLLDDLFNLETEQQELDYLGWIKDAPVITLQAEEIQSMGVPLFSALRQHVENSRLWDNFDSLMLELHDQVQKGFDDPEDSQDRFTAYGRRTIDKKVGAWVQVPMSFSRIPHAGIGLWFNFQLPDSFVVAHKELARELVRGIISGHCDLCPIPPVEKMP
ncbi:MAG: hypothetical protein IH872_01890 [Chloroflexi bacterium]|nr:hypothetical protein [Chloroflexota bacterium]